MSNEIPASKIPLVSLAPALWTPEHFVGDSAWIEHAPFAFWLVDVLRPRNFVELGAHSGYSYFCFCQAVQRLNLGTACHAVDAWTGDEHAGFYGEEVFQSVARHNDRYSAFSALLRMTFDDARRQFPNGSVDLLHIDGRHYYDDVRHDFETWRDKLTKDAIVLFHDTNVRERDFGVWKLFDELKREHATFEFTHGHGLGVLAAKTVPSALRPLFDADQGAAEEWRAAFASLGGKIGEMARLRQTGAELLESQRRLKGANESAEAQLQETRRRLKESSDHAEAKMAAMVGKHAVAASLARRTVRLRGKRSRLEKLWGRIRASVQPKKADLAILRRSLFLDEEWYLATYPDVVAAGMRPAEHYVTFGAAEGRDPGPFFSTRDYLADNPDVAEAGLNPLLHFEKHRWLQSPPRSKSSYANSASSARSELYNRVKHLERLTRYTLQPEVEPQDLASPDFTRLNITWIIPDFMAGAGGHMTIFRIARYLQEFGHNVSLLIQTPNFHTTPQAALETIRTHFQPFDGAVGLLGDELPHLRGDALIATDRFTCYPVQAIGGFRRKFYFVQDYETQFFPMGAEALLTENTYRMGFDCLCAGEWLQSMMQERYNLWAACWPLAHDSTFYFVDKDAQRGTNRIAFYARHATARRAVELGLMALDLLWERGVDFHAEFFGWDIGNLGVKYPYTNHGILSPQRLGNLYRASTIGVVFSATNHSLVNKEMMACGLPVIDLDVESVRASFPDDCLSTAYPLPESIADAISGLLNDASRRDTVAKAGLSFISGLSWEKSARVVEQALIDRLKLSAGG